MTSRKYLGKMEKEKSVGSNSILPHLLVLTVGSGPAFRSERYIIDGYIAMCSESFMLAFKIHLIVGEMRKKSIPRRAISMFMT